MSKIEEKIVNNKVISIITPMFNEEENIKNLAERLSKVTKINQKYQWEWVVVDDGSTDLTQAILIKNCEVFEKYKIITLSRNFGQQAAYKAGLEHATGDAIVFLDADMQDPPEIIPEMVKHWEEGTDNVVGVRISKAERGIRGLCFDVFHVLFFKLTGGIMPKNSGTFGLISKKLAKELIEMPEHNLFLPAQRGWIGLKSSHVYYNRRGRNGPPRQSYKKLLCYAWDGITGFSTVPLQLITLVGGLISGISFVYAMYLITLKIFQSLGHFMELKVLGITTLATSMIFLGGLQLLSIGLLGSYISKIFIEVKGRKHYIISKIKQSPD